MKDTPTIEAIEANLAYWLNFSQNIIVPNLSWGGFVHECDLFVIRGVSGYAVEYEIKRSMADLKGELKKKHGHESSKIRQLFFVIPKYVFENNYIEVRQIIPAHSGIITYTWETRKEDWYGTTHPLYIEFKRAGNAKANPAARRLKPNEIANISRLGAMRVWALKAKLAKCQLK